MILVDSSVWINYLNGKKTPETLKMDAFFDQGLVIIGDIILMEILQGIKSDLEFKKIMDQLKQINCVDLCSKSVAIMAAENYRHLRKRGCTIRKSVDGIIATYCVRHQIPLLYCDRDFAAFETHLGLSNAMNL